MTRVGHTVEQVSKSAKISEIVKKTYIQIIINRNCEILARDNAVIDRWREHSQELFYNKESKIKPKENSTNNT